MQGGHVFFRKETLLDLVTRGLKKGEEDWGLE